MALGMSLSKKNKSLDDSDDSASKKKISDKNIKPRSPKRTLPKKALRTTFWVIASLIVVQGCVATMRGERVIQQINNYGVSSTAIVDDKVKGFAADFASEYFTWNYDNFSDHSKRMSRFIGGGLDSNAGLKTGDAKGSSRALSVEVYSSQQLNSKLTEVTVLVRRELTPAPPANGKQTDSLKPETSKVYIVVPVSQSDNGLLIQTYPRFVGEQLKGDSVKRDDSLKVVTEDAKLKMAKDLADGFFKAWYEGNINQIKYFYNHPEAVPSKISPSSFVLDKVEQVELSKIVNDQGKGDTFQLNVQASVKNGSGESFINVWTLQVVEKDSKMFVESMGQEVRKSMDRSDIPTSSKDNAPSKDTPTTEENNK